jgi:hypothetical protein
MNSQEADCVPDPGYDDIVAGTQVTVTDETGRLIGVGTLAHASPGFVNFQCMFTFSVAGLPDAAFYGLTVGRRAGPTYSLTELQGAGWNVQLSIGT